MTPDDPPPEAPRGAEPPPAFLPPVPDTPAGSRPVPPPAPAERRLHPAAIGVSAVAQLRSLALPLLAVILLGSRGGPEMVAIAAAGLLFAVGAAILSWLRTTWSLVDDTVRLRRALIGESVTTIPFDRVQAIDEVQGPIQRLFGVVELHVQAAGGGRTAEIVLSAVTPAEAAEIREAVREAAEDGASGGAGAAATAATVGEAGGGASAGAAAGAGPAAGPAGAPAAPAVVWRLSRGDLVRAAVTSGSLGVLIPVVAGLSQVLDDVIGADEAQALLPDTWDEAALAAVAVLAVAWLLSFLGTIVAFGGFTAVREGDRLRLSRGIIERRESSVPVARVHAVRILESPLREPFGLAQVRIETAGYANERATAQTLLPLVRRDEAPAVLARLLPELDAPPVVEPVPARAARRFVLWPALAGLVAGAVPVAILGVAALPALVLAPLGALAGLAHHRAAGVARHGEHVVLRARTATLTRSTAIADARRLQTVQTSVNPFQRRARLATLAVDVSSGRRLRVRHVDDGAAAEHAGALIAAAIAGPRAVRPS
jgi:putative membrane protein